MSRCIEDCPVQARNDHRQGTTKLGGDFTSSNLGTLGVILYKKV